MNSRSRLKLLETDGGDNLLNQVWHGVYLAVIFQYINVLLFKIFSTSCHWFRLKLRLGRLILHQVFLLYPRLFCC